MRLPGVLITSFLELNNCFSYSSEYDGTDTIGCFAFIGSASRYGIYGTDTYAFS